MKQLWEFAGPTRTPCWLPCVRSLYALLMLWCCCRLEIKYNQTKNKLTGGTTRMHLLEFTTKQLFKQCNADCNAGSCDTNMEVLFTSPPQGRKLQQRDEPQILVPTKSSWQAFGEKLSYNSQMGQAQTETEHTTHLTLQLSLNFATTPPESRHGGLSKLNHVKTAWTHQCLAYPLHWIKDGLETQPDVMRAEAREAASLRGVSRNFKIQ